MRLVILSILLFLFCTSFGQNAGNPPLSYNGFYIAKTGGIPAANIEIFTYLIFYSDGTVCLQTVTSNSPQEVAAWFGKDKKFSQKGKYQVEGNTVTIMLDNQNSEDRKLEGAQETSYSGILKSDTEICLLRNKEEKEHCFLFYPVASLKK